MTRSSSQVRAAEPRAGIRRRAFVFGITILLCAGIYIFFGRPEGARGAQGAAPPVEFIFAANGSDYAAGEELEYEVSYAFFHLGEIKIKVKDVFQEGGTTYVRAEANIDSYSGVPFVDLHAVFESEFSATPASKFFTARSKSDDRWYVTTYDFRYDTRKVYVVKGWQDAPPDKRDTLEMKGDPEDGLSLFFFARVNSGQQKQVVVPSYVGEKRGRTFIKFSSEVATTDIDAVDYPVKVNELEGEADFTGIFGLTGGFSGMFSADDAHVPIVAKMNVLIGKVRIELKRWSRNGWQPPRA